MPKELSPDAILYIMGNDTRRRILGLLAGGPRYLSQLSRELGDVSITAVKRHLELLDASGLVSSLRGGGGGPGPERRYYTLRSPLQLTLSLAPSHLEVKLGVNSNLKAENVGGGREVASDVLESLDQAIAKLEELRGILVKLRGITTAQPRLTVDAGFKVSGVEEFIGDVKRRKQSLKAGGEASS